MMRALLIAFCLALVSCATTPDPVPEQPGAETQTSFTVRYNPAPCECPPFEFLYGEVWVRAFVELEDPSELDQLREAGPLATATVAGRLGGRGRIAENGVRYAIFKDP